ncbi:protein CLT1, chloroplastic-like [Carya illinoinensis]|uniref:protein CLT1, chloroplastic-like n=1 Tax=Carya illinoinensis TaxID=32201 RepID=UPI001C71BBF3|nr:protein CLT1, chloroplastic-like [Carya illinoinensis]
MVAAVITVGRYFAAASQLRDQQRSGMVLRSRLLVVGEVGTGGTWDGEEKEVSPCSCAVGHLAEKCGSEDQRVEEDGDSASRDRTVKVAMVGGGCRQWVGEHTWVDFNTTVVLGVGNRVLYKLALVPLKHYPFFLAQLATFGYVVVYFSILYLRYHAGIVTDEMLSMRKAPFLAVGFLEALGAATGMAAGAILSGASIPILSQTFLVWQILLSIIFLGRRYRVNQLLGCFFVAVGVIITVASGSSAGHSLKEAGIFWSLLMITSFLFQGADTVLKEVIFLDAARNLNVSKMVESFHHMFLDWS